MDKTAHHNLTGHVGHAHTPSRLFLFF